MQDEYPIGTFEPGDLAYAAFVDDCLREGIDPNSADAVAFAFGADWTLEDIPAEDMLASELAASEDIPF